MDEMDNNYVFEEIIENESFIKNLKRMFITKQMEIHNIHEVIIKFDKETSSFNFNIIKDKKGYGYEYKIRRRKKKIYTKNKEKIENYNNTESSSRNINQVPSIINSNTRYTSSPTLPKINNESSSLKFVVNEHKKYQDVNKSFEKTNNDGAGRSDLITNTINNNCKYLIDIKNKEYSKHNKKELHEVDKMDRKKIHNSVIKYNCKKNDIIYRKLYKHITIFIRKNIVNKNIQMILRDITNIFKKYRFNIIPCFLNHQIFNNKN